MVSRRGNEVDVIRVLDRFDALKCEEQAFDSTGSQESRIFTIENLGKNDLMKSGMVSRCKRGGVVDTLVN